MRSDPRQHRTGVIPLRRPIPRAIAFGAILAAALVSFSGGSAGAGPLAAGVLGAAAAPPTGPALNQNCTDEPAPYNPGNGEDIITAAGYKVEVFAQGLNFPTAIAFQGGKRDFKVLVLESGTGLPGACNNRQGPGYATTSTTNPFTPDILVLDKNGHFVAGPIGKPDNTVKDCPPSTIGNPTSNKFQCDGPAVGLAFQHVFNGTLFATDSNQGARGAPGSGNNTSRIVTVNLGSDSLNPYITRLPTGDHPTEQVIVKDGYLYWSQGSATNSGVTGHDNGAGGNQHDIPCQDVVLSSTGFDSGDGHVTSGYSNHGTFTPGATVPAFTGAFGGMHACTGAILRSKILEDGKPGPVEPYSWGYRNPFGIRFAPQDHPLQGHLLITENGEDERGARPTNNAPDRLQVAEPMGSDGKLVPDYHGWPDRFGFLDSAQAVFNPVGGPADDACPTTTPNTPAETACLKAHGDIPVQHVLAYPPQQPRAPLALEPADVAVVGPDFAPNSFVSGVVKKGAAFVSREGDFGFSPDNGEPEAGHDVELVNFSSALVGSSQPLQVTLQKFAYNCPTANQMHYPDGAPACVSVPGNITSQPTTGGQAFCAKDGPLRGINRPVTLMFGPDGDLYIVDYGVVRDFGQSDPNCKFVNPAHAPLVQIPHTGVIWKISRTSTNEDR
jgi:hypothetical protein